ncbi:putative mitochondrial carrier domain superfamily [Helianthus annuus]|nr:putative mitochondrial carrier domain superfamily [Helianthus annuus]
MILYAPLKINQNPDSSCLAFKQYSLFLNRAEVIISKSLEETLFLGSPLQDIGYSKLAFLPLQYGLWLYNGFGWLATGRMLGVGARFGTYELLTAFYKDGRKDNYVYVSEALTTGIVAGGVESLMNSLFELFTIRAQVSAVSRVPNSSTNLQKASVSTSVTKLLRGYNPDVKALDHSIGLVCCPP